MKTNSFEATPDATPDTPGKAPFEIAGLHRQTPVASVPACVRRSSCSHSRDCPHSADLAQRALHRFLLDMVALVYEVEMSALLSPTRGRKKTAFARQVAMYLAHTGGGLSLSCVGRLFARDRTTVAHACALVEDARDQPVFDRTLSHLESAISCQMDLFRSSCGNVRECPETAKGGRS